MRFVTLIVCDKLIKKSVKLKTKKLFKFQKSAKLEKKPQKVGIHLILALKKSDQTF